MLWRRKRQSPATGRERDAGTAGPADVRATVLDEADVERQAISEEQALAALRRIVAEAVIWQDAAEELLVDVRAREPLAIVAPRGGELVSRFVALSRTLPDPRDADLRRQVDLVRSVLEHHAMLLSTSIDLLSVDWRSERVVEQLERIDGLGQPAQWLEAVRAELVASA
jgi:hypothetical protein